MYGFVKQVRQFLSDGVTIPKVEKYNADISTSKNTKPVEQRVQTNQPQNNVLQGANSTSDMFTGMPIMQNMQFGPIMQNAQFGAGIPMIQNAPLVIASQNNIPLSGANNEAYNAKVSMSAYPSYESIDLLPCIDDV